MKIQSASRNIDQCCIQSDQLLHIKLSKFKKSYNKQPQKLNQRWVYSSAHNLVIQKPPRKLEKQKKRQQQEKQKKQEEKNPNTPATKTNITAEKKKKLGQKQGQDPSKISC